jgi:hypothetical protein
MIPSHTNVTNVGNSSRTSIDLVLSLSQLRKSIKGATHHAINPLPNPSSTTPIPIPTIKQHNIKPNQPPSKLTQNEVLHHRPRPPPHRRHRRPRPRGPGARRHAQSTRLPQERPLLGWKVLYCYLLSWPGAEQLL